jgi:hypothetical protein
MTTKRRKIVSANVKYISLCPRGKNLISTLYKEDDGTVEFSTLVKADQLEEKGELTDISDADGDFADRDGIASMCKSFMKNGAQIDLRHNEKPLSRDEIYVSECFLSKSGDAEFAGMQDKLGRELNMDGAMVIRLQVDSEELRKSYREGEWDGVSLFGPAQVEMVSKEQSTEDILDALAFRLRGTSNNPEDEIDMKPEDLKKALDEQTVALAKAVTEGVVTALKPAEETVEETVTKASDEVSFVGDKANPADVLAHAEKLKLAQLQKSVDWSDPASVAAYHAQIAKADDEETQDESDPLKKQLADLQKEIDKRDAASTQGSPAAGKGKYTNLSKEDAECAEAADRMAKFANGQG